MLSNYLNLELNKILKFYKTEQTCKVQLKGTRAVLSRAGVKSPGLMVISIL